MTTVRTTVLEYHLTVEVQIIILIIPAAVRVTLVKICLLAKIFENFLTTRYSKTLIARLVWYYSS